MENTINMIEAFQFILLGSSYDAIRNPLNLDGPWQGNKLNAHAVGCRWKNQGVWVTKFSGLPEQDMATIDASPFPDYSAVVVIERTKDDRCRDNAYIYEPDGSLRERLASPFGAFWAISFEGKALGFLVADGPFREMWVEYDHQARCFGRSHPVR